MASFYQIPIVVHESDAIAGLATRFAAKRAKIVELGFQEAAQTIHRGKAEMYVVGNPIREEALQTFDQKSAKMEFGFNPDLPVALVLGGSQGAQILNTFVLEHLVELTSEVQILHQVGSNNILKYSEEYEFLYKNKVQEIGQSYHFEPYFEKTIHKAYAAADIVIARAGANTIFEIAGHGKPSILIPLKGSSNDHQKRNAYIYAETGAAIVFEEDNFLVNLLRDLLKNLFSDPARISSMQEAARRFYKPNALQAIHDDIMRVLFG